MRRIALEMAERRLPSGLTLLAVRNPGVPTFAAQAALDVDQRVEPKGKEGIAHLTGESLEEGTERRTGVELARAIEEIGGSMEGTASGGVVQCPAAEARKAVRLLAEFVLVPSFPSREVARVRQEVLTEIRADEDDPRTVAALRFRREVYGSHPYGRPRKGYARTVAALRPADLRRFHARWFAPDGGYVAAAGPDDPERTLDVLERAFRSLNGSAPPRPQPAPPGLPDERREVHVPMPREQVHVYLGHVGIRRTDPDFHALLVMDHVLGSGPGFTSRIARRLRDELGLCYAVSASITSSAGEEPGVFSAYIGTSPEHRKKAIDGFLREIRRIRREPPTPQELEDVKAYLTGSYVFALERNANLVAYAIRVKRFELGFDYLERYPDLVRAVTPEEVRAVARRHLHPHRVVVVSAGAGSF